MIMFKLSKLHGYAEYVNRGKYSYKGKWKKNKKNVQGILVDSDGSKYEGGWLNEQHHGKGKKIYYFGDTNDGMQEHASYHSYGEEHCRRQGWSYKDEFKEDCRYGQEIEVFLDAVNNGLKYEGECLYNKRYRAFKQTLPNKNMYE